MKRNENFWSYRLHKLGTPKVLRTDGRSGPTTRPAFAKATQVTTRHTARVRERRNLRGRHRSELGGSRTKHPGGQNIPQRFATPDKTSHAVFGHP